MTEDSEDGREQRFQSTRRRFLGAAALTGAVASVGAMTGSNGNRADVAAVQSDGIDPVYGFPAASADEQPPVEPDHEVSLSVRPAEGREVPEFPFDPVGLAVEAGDVVMFTMDVGAHTVTAYHPELERTRGVPEDAPPYSSPLVAHGGYWLYRFDHPGVHDVYCLPHEQFGMAARVVVGEGDGTETDDGGIPDILPVGDDGDETGTANATDAGNATQTGNATNATDAGTSTEEPLLALQQGQQIELGGETQAWMGRAPAEIEGQSNPTLSLTPGQSYAVTWENVDGAPHNFAVLDGNGEAVVSSEIIDQQGATQTVEFEATEAMAEYLCEVHPNTMRGDIELAAAETETATATETGTETPGETPTGTETETATGTGTPTRTGTETGTPSEGEELPQFPPAPAAQRVLNDPALDPENIVEQGSVAWNDLAPESRGFPPKGPDYVASLSGDNQVPPVDTPATGEAAFFVTERGFLRYHVVAHDIEDVTQAHIHSGGPDENGPIVIPLFALTENPDGTGEGEPASATDDQPFEMTGVVRDADFVALVTNPPENLAGGFYVNVHTVENPGGEIRGQLQRPAEAEDGGPLGDGEETPDGTAEETPEDETPEGETETPEDGTAEGTETPDGADATEGETATPEGEAAGDDAPETESAGDGTPMGGE